MCIRMVKHLLVFKTWYWLDNHTCEIRTCLVQTRKNHIKEKSVKKKKSFAYKYIHHLYAIHHHPNKCGGE